MIKTVITTSAKLELHVLQEQKSKRELRTDDNDNDNCHFLGDPVPI